MTKVCWKSGDPHSRNKALETRVLCDSLDQWDLALDNAQKLVSTTVSSTVDNPFKSDIQNQQIEQCNTNKHSRIKTTSVQNSDINILPEIIEQFQKLKHISDT